MRVWVISSSYPRYPEESVNAGVVARDLALSLSEAGHEVTVVTPQKPGGVRVDPQVKAITLPWLRPTLSMADLSGSKLGDLARMASLFLGARPVLRREVRRGRPDAVLALWALPSGIFARWVRRRTGAPYALWLLGSDVWKAGAFPGGRRIFRRVVVEAATVHADGSALAEEAERLSGRSVAFLPSCRRLPPPPPPEALPRAVDILFVGRYHPNKGPDVLLEAFALLRERRPHATLRLHGSGELRPQLERAVARLGLAPMAEILGPVTARELSGAMRRAKVLAIPSRIESIPLILGDAVQAGLPVVATAVGDLSEIVETSGIGVTVPPEDPPALAASLDHALADPIRLPSGAGPGWLSPDGLAERLLEGLR